MITLGKAFAGGGSHATHIRITMSPAVQADLRRLRPLRSRRKDMKTLRTAVMVASLGWAVASSMPVQAQTVGYNIRTGDVWVDARLGKV